MKELKFFGTCMSICAIFFFFLSCKDDCTNACLNGVLDENSCECTCDNGFSGNDCSVEDLCITQNPNCQNGAACDMGSCLCPNGYEGEDCSQEFRAKFIGNYIGSQSCDVDGMTMEYQSNILTEGSDPGSVVIFGLGDVLFDKKIIASIDGYDISVPDQSPNGDDIRIEGSGLLSEDGTTLSWEFKVTNTTTNIFDNCTMLATKE